MTLKQWIIATALVLMVSGAQAQTRLTVDAGQRGATIEHTHYGIFFEEINHAGDGGLYAELVRNRNFREGTDYWSAKGSATLTAVATGLLNEAQTRCLKVKMNAADAGVRNTGYWGMKFEEGKTYRLSLWCKAEGGYDGRLTATLLNNSGTAIGAATIETAITGEWQQLTAEITATANATAGKLQLTGSAKGTICLDVVSLFPPTFKGRANGCREDLAQMLADLKPAFVRFPGGCYVEGHGTMEQQNRFEWKKTIGPIEQRAGHRNANWNYEVTDGLGFHEYLELCEDLGAEPLFVCNIGLGHGYTTGVSEADLKPYIDEVLDAIEYANGDASTEWGAKRVANGHAAPFGLRMIEVGNENNQDENARLQSDHYYTRYRMFREAILAKYPGMFLIGNVAAWGTDTPAWRTTTKAEAVDEHYYRNPYWFANHYHHYDGYDREGPKVYVGEYAVTSDFGTTGNLRAALGEAAYMLGMERNSDVVCMTSYAPIFVNENDQCWKPDMIRFNASKSFGTPSYYVQRMMANHVGRQNVLFRWGDDGKVPADLYTASSIDDEAGKLYVKLVNFGKTATPLTIDLLHTTATAATVEVMTSANATDENTMSSPNKVKPTNAELSILNSQLSYMLPANAVAIITLDVTGTEIVEPVWQGASELLNGQFDLGVQGWHFDASLAGRPVAGGSSKNPCMEVFNADFDIWQELSGLQPGYYKLTVQGFQRTAANDLAWSTYQNGTAKVTTVIYGGTSAKPVHNIMAKAQTTLLSEGNCYTTPLNTYVPNDMLSSSAAFTAGLYQNSLTVNVGDDCRLRVGIRSIGGTEDARWTCCDNFVLTYVGTEKPNDDDEEQVSIDEQLKQDRHELQGALGARYMHQGCSLPSVCTYGTIAWNFTPSVDNGSPVATFVDNKFTVNQRTDESVTIGTLQGIITIDDTDYPVFDQPITVTVAPDDNAVGYLYCHMPDMVPKTGTPAIVSQTITYALGRAEDKGLVYHELNRGEGIIPGIGTSLPWCRDAFLAKDPKRHCYYIVTTDLYGSRDNGTSMLENYSIGMFRSFDLINWTYSRCDLKQYLRQNPPAGIYDNSGTKKFTADKVSRVWAPQIILIDGTPYIYYAVGNTDNGDCDHFYISRANEDFTGIESFQLLYGPNKKDNILDADIVWLETDQRYHMSFRDYEAGCIRDITCTDLLNPVWDEASVSAFADGRGFEASSVFRRINEDVWNVGNVNYSSRRGFHFHTADALLRNLKAEADLSGNLSPQHGSFVMVSQTEWDVVQSWSDLRGLLDKATALIAESSSVSGGFPVGTSTELNAAVQQAEQHLADQGEATVLSSLAANLKADCATLKDLLQKYSTNLRPEDIDALKADATEVSIKNGTFDSNASGWTAQPAPGTANGVAEFFAQKTGNYSASLYQTLTGLDEGDYLVTCQAFERNGFNDGYGLEYLAGCERLKYRLFANTDSTAVASLYSLAYTGDNSLNGFANGMLSANALFQQSPDNYLCAVRTHVGTDGRLRFGLARGSSGVHTSDWCCFDNFHVYRLNTSETGIDEIKNKDFDRLKRYGKTEAHDLQGRLLSHQPINRGIYIVNGKKIICK